MIRGEVRLYRFASPDKRRLVVILTRTSTLRFLNRATVAPITTTIRGIPTEVVLGPEDGMREPCAVNLDTLQTVPTSGMGRALAILSHEKLAQIEEALAFALGFEDS